MTPKQKVLRRFPRAVCLPCKDYGNARVNDTGYDISIRDKVVSGHECGRIIAHAETRAEAWAAAADFLSRPGRFGKLHAGD